MQISAVGKIIGASVLPLKKEGRRRERTVSCPGTVKTNCCLGLSIFHLLNPISLAQKPVEGAFRDIGNVEKEENKYEITQNLNKHSWPMLLTVNEKSNRMMQFTPNKRDRYSQKIKLN